jgi:hypothetical protein
MKQLILIAIVICTSFAAKAQYAPVEQDHKVDNSAYQHMRNKSTNAKIEAVILNITAITACVVGTGLVVIGEIDKASNEGAGTYDANDNFIPSDYKSDNQLINTGFAVGGAGVLIGIGSAVLYTRSAILYHRAREIKMSMHSNSINIPSATKSLSLPQAGIGFSISL